MWFYFLQIHLDMRLDRYRSVSFKLSMMINITELSSSTPVLMSVTLIHGHRYPRKRNQYLQCIWILKSVWCSKRNIMCCCSFWFFPSMKYSNGKLYFDDFINTKQNENKNVSLLSNIYEPSSFKLGIKSEWLWHSLKVTGSRESKTSAIIFRRIFSQFR